MKESVLDILIYLFENYFDPAFDLDDNEIDADGHEYHDRDSLKDELEQAGFPLAAIDSALEWFDSLAVNNERDIAPSRPRTIRVFAERECAKLDVDCRNYILYLENIGILNAIQRELVIDRLLALNTQPIDIEQLKWVVLMVLFTQRDQEDAFLRMEDLLIGSRAEALH